MPTKKIKSGKAALLVFFLVGAMFFPRGGVKARESSLPLKNGPAQVVVGIQDGMLAHTAFTISRSEPVRVHYAEGYEFVVRLPDRDLTPFDFTLTRPATISSDSLTLEFQAKDLSLHLRLHYRQEPGAFFIRKWLELVPGPGEEFFVDEIVLWAFEPWVPAEAFAGLGQPVYVGDAFFGVAYPAAENEVLSGKVCCRYRLGLKIGEQGYTSREAVYGVAEPGKVREAFLAYVDKIRARPLRPFLLWNTWYDLRNYSEEEVLTSLASLRHSFVEPYGIKLDAVVLDDGWDDFKHLWQPHPERFPHGLTPVRQAAHELGAELGLWMSPVGGYLHNQQRRLWKTIGQGYERNIRGFCFAGENYRHLFTNRMLEYEQQLGVNYFKLDNLNRTCPVPFHGHRVGRYARVGLTDAFIATLTAVRQAKPEVMINFTVGSWLSPWWLQYADVLWRGDMDYGARGEGSRRQQAITYVDAVLYKRLRREKAQFPLSSLMTHGIIKGRYQAFGEEGENLRDFADDCWMFFGRGVMMHELYLSPDRLSPAEWEVLAQAVQFARQKAELLAHSEMVGGNPGEGEVYGFYHAHAGESLWVVRNPAGREQELLPEIVSSFSGGEGEREQHRVVYSSVSNPVAAPLAPFEVRVFFVPPPP